MTRSIVSRGIQILALTIFLVSADAQSIRSIVSGAVAARIVSTTSLAQAGGVSSGDRVTWRPFRIQLLEQPFRARYSRRGLELSSPEGGFTARMRWRVQPRFATPYEEDPRRASKFYTEDADKLTMNRARFKVEGTTFNGFLDYKFEQDLVGGRMIDLFTDINFRPWFSVRVGQWKSVFSQERYISSGNQQFVERSIVNREFNMDRQAGVAINGRLAAGTHRDMAYSLEILNGTGMNSGFSLASPLLVGRYQWNFLGTDPGFSSSDTDISETPAAFLAVTGLHNTSAFTRFSSAGGGQLDGFSSTTDTDRYNLKQLNGEFTFKYRGFSVQSETHWKRIQDNQLDELRFLRGGYYQGGYMLGALLDWVPEGIEVGYRYAFVDPNTGLTRDIRTENTFVFNYFFEGHSNKLTLDISRLGLQQSGAPTLHEARYRVQYDIHF